MKSLSAVRRLVMVLTLCVSGVSASVQASDSALVDRLTSQLGITVQQAEGGAGAIFKTAKDNLQESEFATVAQAVPGIEALMSAAPKNSASSGLGAITSMFGGSAKQLGAFAGLTSSFSELGMDSEMLAKFIPVVLDYVKSTGGDQTTNLLAGVLQ